MRLLRPMTCLPLPRLNYQQQLEPFHETPRGLASLATLEYCSNTIVQRSQECSLVGLISEDAEAIDEQTTTWDKIIIDRQGELFEWVKELKKARERRIMILAFANNHYAGY